MGKQLKILELNATNVLRLKAIHIVPDETMQVIGGENAQGKSSALKCIEMAMGGKKVIPSDPIRRGVCEGEIGLKLGTDGELVYDIVRSGEKLEELVVRNADGVPQKSPQGILDALYSKVGFSPMAFVNQKPAEQLATCKRVVGLDFTALDNERATLYDKRTRIGRSVDSASERYVSFPVSCITAPDEEISVAELMDEKLKADKHNAELDRLELAMGDANKRVGRLTADLKAAKEDQAKATQEWDNFGGPIDTTGLVAKITGAGAINMAVKAKRDRAEAHAKLKKCDAEYKALTKQIEAIDAEKANQLASAKWPIEGLGFGTEGVTYKGLPFEQASASERLRVGFAIGAALSPQLAVVLMEDASLLDKASMKQLREMAAEKNMQVWVERVGDADKGAVIIEDGEVVGDGNA